MKLPLCSANPSQMQMEFSKHTPVMLTAVWYDSFPGKTIICYNVTPYLLPLGIGWLGLGYSIPFTNAICATVAGTKVKIIKKPKGKENEFAATESSYFYSTAKSPITGLGYLQIFKGKSGGRVKKPWNVSLSTAKKIKPASSTRWTS